MTFPCMLLVIRVNAAMVPELWLTEGGQSATGALLDHIVETHPAAPALANRAAHQSEYYFCYILKYLLSAICVDAGPPEG